jgi:hypothetical protein
VRRKVTVVVSLGLMFAFAIAVAVYTKTWNVAPGILATVVNDPTFLVLAVGFIALVAYGWSATNRPSKAKSAEQQESLTSPHSSE